jgi:uridine monophosphate synthetase
MANPAPLPFFARLAEAARRNSSLLCVGLDPALDAGGDVYDANRRIVDAARGEACVFKPQYAFYEARGFQGLEALRKTIDYAHQAGLPVILDAKRNDIASSAEAYAVAAFDVWGADAVTVNPYLGGDTVAPFTNRTDRGVFLLCHTSNPGAKDIQEIDCGGAPLFETVARLAAGWNTAGNAGLVVGATYPKELARVRAIAPGMWFLLPGVGAQGADLDAAVRAGLDADGMGIVVNVSRGIAQAADPRKAAREYREAIERARAAAASSRAAVSVPAAAADPTLIDSIAVGLHELGAVRFGEFTLKSGQKSPIYVDLRLLSSGPKLLALVARAMAGLLKNVRFDRIAAIPYGGLPIGTAVSLETGKPMIYPRKEAKQHGTMQAIEGLFQAGETVVVLDDLITTGGAKIEAVGPLESAGLKVRDVLVLIDREQGGKEQLAQRGYTLHAVLSLRTLLDSLVRAGRIAASLRGEVLAALGAG